MPSCTSLHHILESMPALPETALLVGSGSDSGSSSPSPSSSRSTSLSTEMPSRTSRNSIPASMPALPEKALHVGSGPLSTSTSASTTDPKRYCFACQHYPKACKYYPELRGFACKYSTPEEQAARIVCTPEPCALIACMTVDPGRLCCPSRTYTQSQRQKSTETPGIQISMPRPAKVLFMKATHVSKIFAGTSNDDTKAEKELEGLVYVYELTPGVMTSYSEHARDLARKAATPAAVELLAEGKPCARGGQGLPSITLTGPSDCNPSMNLGTWKVLGKSAYEGNTAVVDVLLTPAREKKGHGRDCRCELCHMARKKSKEFKRKVLGVDSSARSALEDFRRGEHSFVGLDDWILTERAPIPDTKSVVITDDKMGWKKRLVLDWMMPKKALKKVRRRSR